MLAPSIRGNESSMASNWAWRAGTAPVTPTTSPDSPPSSPIRVLLRQVDPRRAAETLLEREVREHRRRRPAGLERGRGRVGDRDRAAQLARGRASRHGSSPTPPGSFDAGWLAAARPRCAGRRPYRTRAGNPNRSARRLRRLLGLAVLGNDVADRRPAVGAELRQGHRDRDGGRDPGERNQKPQRDHHGRERAATSAFLRVRSLALPGHPIPSSTPERRTPAGRRLIGSAKTLWCGP